MKNFLIVSRTDKTQYGEMIERAKQYIVSHGGNCQVLINYSEDETSFKELDVPEETQCVLTVGGDGTMIRTAQMLAHRKLPFAGINCGHLGYLCDIDRENLEECLDLLMADSFELEKRMMLRGSTKESREYNALNDIVINAGTVGTSVIRLTVYVNGSYLFAYNCDGLIFSTPTGSTAYNLSSGGPIVNPKTSCILLTPINAHTLNSRSIVLDMDDCIEVELNARHPEDENETAIVSFDGYEKKVLKPGDRVSIKRSEDTTEVVKFTDTSFLERIRIRMQEK